MALQAMQPMRTRKPDTEAQWNRALDRALSEALGVLTEPTSGQTFVESSQHPGTLCRVTPESCSCAVGGRGIPCKHRACLLAQLGILPLDDGPAPVAQPAKPTVYRVIAPGNRLYSEHHDQGEAIKAINWMHRCYSDGGDRTVEVAA